MLYIERFINELMTSNCYVVYNGNSKQCLVVDPASEKCEQVITYLDENHLIPQYIILTHEHTDHTWGVNTIVDRYDAKVVCSSKCKEALPVEGNTYFQFYYDDPNYKYVVKRVDVVLEDVDFKIKWNGQIIDFISTPGHSNGSVCFVINDYLFTGDAFMQYKPYIDKRKGSLEQYRISVKYLLGLYGSSSMTVCPGHGEPFAINEYSNLLSTF